ncbi:hypothetical protein D3C76_1607770 [compost metagenome]
MLADILNDKQRKAFTQVASFWTWLDRDGKPHWQLGTCNADPEPLVVPDAIGLTDAQYELFACISNAQKLMAKQFLAEDERSKEKRFNQLYFMTRKASEEGYFAGLEQYVLEGSNGEI